MGQITIAIDGGAGVGKGTTALGVAQELNYRYLDTGAMYRAVAYFMLHHGIPVNDEKLITHELDKIHLEFSEVDESGKTRIIMNGEDIEDKIRTPEVTAVVSQVASYLPVRAFLLSQQQKIAGKGGIVVDGRDAGSKICPQAELKVHLIADLDIRAQRRYLQYQEQGKDIDLEGIRENLQLRDQLDLTGPDASSYIAADARELDTSNITIDQQIQQVVGWALEIINE